MKLISKEDGGYTARARLAGTLILLLGLFQEFSRF